MEIRRYRPDDLEQIAQLFHDTVHSINAKDYTQEQLNAWAPDITDKTKWNNVLIQTNGQSRACSSYAVAQKRALKKNVFLEHRTYVATQNRMIIGFGNMDATGYLDKLFVHKNFQRTGVATVICDRLESETRSDIITVHASITAKPFFEKRGFVTVKRQEVERKGIRLTNYIMKKSKNSRPTHSIPQS